MKLVQYDPISDLRKLDNEFDNMLKNGWGIFPSLTEIPAMDMYEEDGKLITKINLPNFAKHDIKVSAENGVLEISAEHAETDQNKNKRHYYVRESSNSYLRRVAVPENVDSNNVEANFKHGALTISMPTLETKKSKLIDIK